METVAAFIPLDRRSAMLRGESLPTQMQGTALLCDVSGYTPLIEALIEKFGGRRAVNRLTQQINQLFTLLIAQVHRHRGSVTGFGGDALLCWFDEDQGQNAAMCALAMVVQMRDFAGTAMSATETVDLTLKVTLAHGNVRRFHVGEPTIQYFDVLAGAVITRVAEMQAFAVGNSILIDAALCQQLSDQFITSAWPREVNQQSFYRVEALRLSDAHEASIGDAPPLSLYPTPDAAPLLESLSYAQARPWLLAPVYERLVEGHSDFLADIRPVVILFLKFNGLDYENDEEVGGRLNTYICWVQQILTRYAGFLIKLTIDEKGSYLLAAFGAPLANVQDTERCLAAALALRLSPNEFPWIDGVQIGLSQGQVLAGAFGSRTRAAYDLLGSQVNIANRLMSSAEPGQILVSEKVVEATAGSYRFSAPIRVRLKGVGEVSVYEALGRSVLRLPLLKTRLINRENEFAQMSHLLAQAKEGNGQLLRIEGAAGVGKSHLTGALIAKALNDQWDFALGVCEAIGQNTSYYPWRNLLVTWLGLLDEAQKGQERLSEQAQIDKLARSLQNIQPEWVLLLPLLGELLHLPIAENATTAAYHPQQRRETVQVLVGELIKQHARQQPLLLVFEDAQWMDEASRQLTVAVMRNLTNAQVLLMLVHRPRDEVVAADDWLLQLDSLPVAHHMLLAELASAEIVQLIESQLSGEASPLLLDLVQARAQGNPFYVEELLTALRELGRLIFDPDAARWELSAETIAMLRAANCLRQETAGDAWRLRLDRPLPTTELGTPDSIHQLVLSRIDRLPEACQFALKVASVIGWSFTLDLVAQSHPQPVDRQTTFSHMRLLQERNLIQAKINPTGLLYNFYHHIVQEAAYNTLVEEQQSTLHAAVGHALELQQPDAVEALAHHFYRGSVHEKSLLYLDRAARKTQRDYANQTALTYYEQALTLERRWHWLQGKAEVLHILGQREEEEQTLELLAAAPAVPLFTVHYCWGQYYQAISEFLQAATAMQQAWQVAQAEGHLVDEIRCLAQLGLIAWKHGDYQKAERYYEQALARLQVQAVQTEAEAEALMQTLNGLGTLYRQQGEFPKAANYYEQALERSRVRQNRFQEARTLENLGSLAYHRRDFTTAKVYHETVLTIRKTLGDRAGEGTSLYNLALDYQESGDYAYARDCLFAAQKIHQITGNRWEEVNIYIGLGINAYELGDLNSAKLYLEQGLRMAERIDDREGQAYLLSNLGLVICDLGDVQTAEHYLLQGLTYMEHAQNQHQIAFFLSYLAIVDLIAGNFAQAITHANRSCAIRRDLKLDVRMADDFATLADAHMALGNQAEMVHYAMQTLEILDGCAGIGPEFSPRNYYICYRVYTAARADAQAHHALRAAYNLVRQRAEKIVDNELRRSFLTQVAINRQIVETAQQVLEIAMY